MQPSLLNTLNKIEFKEIKHWSPEYRTAIYLRYKILREPQKLHFTRQQFEKENEQIHVVGMINGKVIAYLCLIPFHNNRYRMRQVAVKKKMQGKGIGRELVKFCESMMLKRNAAEIFMHSREYAIGFYKKLDYEVYGELFYEIGLPHYKMRKYFVID